MISLNSVFYPKPEPGYTSHNNNLEIFDGIPCLYIQPYFEKNEKNSQTHVVYFHGNAEDIGYSEPFLVELSDKLKMTFVAVEYPSYGIYSSKEVSSKQIEIDAENVIRCLMKTKNLKQEDIILFGRSLGSGPACYSATKFSKIRCLILMSAYTSLKDVAFDKVPILPLILKEQFPNLKRSQKITCPTLLIHGMDDPLIVWTHSEKIFSKLQTSQSRKRFLKFPGMTHNDFSVTQHLVIPIMDFLSSLQDINQCEFEQNQKKEFEDKQHQNLIETRHDTFKIVQDKGTCENLNKKQELNKNTEQQLNPKSENSEGKQQLNHQSENLEEEQQIILKPNF